MLGTDLDKAAVGCNACDAERWQAFLAALQQGSEVSWQYVNLHGEYDFSDEKI
jgi:ribonuclease HI